MNLGKPQSGLALALGPGMIRKCMKEDNLIVKCILILQPFTANKTCTGRKRGVSQGCR